MQKTHDKKRTSELAKKNEALQAEIAEHKQKEAVLRDNEEIYRRILETANEGIWILDERDSTIFVNQKMAEMFGYTVGELTDRPDYLLADKGWRNLIRKQKVRHRKDSGGLGEYRFLRQDGTVLWVIVNGTAFFSDDGCYDGVIGMFTDITERKQIEETLRVSDERFSKTFHNSPCIMSIVSCVDRRYIDVNEAFLSVTGLAFEKIIGHKDEELGWGYIGEEIEDILKEEVPSKNFELRFTGRSGQELRASLSREVISVNREPCFLYMGIEVTTQKKKQATSFEDLSHGGQAVADNARSIAAPVAVVRRCLQNFKQRQAVFRGVLTIFCIALILLLSVTFLPSSFGKETSSLPASLGKEASSAPVSVPAGEPRLSPVSVNQQRQIPSTYNDKIVVLTYHDVEPKSENSITVTPQRLDADLTLLQQQGFHIIPISQMAAFMERRGTVPEKAVVLTFDDGYQGVYQYAFPVLKKHNAPATVFIIGYYIDRMPEYLTWAEIKQLEESGLVTIGGHTYNQHEPEQTITPNLVKPATIGHLFDAQTGHEETDREYEARMLADSQLLQEAFQSELGHTTPYFAYPYGAYNPTMIKILKSTGFRYLFTVINGVNDRGEDLTRLYRVNAGATWISAKNLPSIVRSAAFYSSSEQPEAWLPEWKAGK